MCPAGKALGSQVPTAARIPRCIILTSVASIYPIWMTNSQHPQAVQAGRLLRAGT